MIYTPLFKHLPSLSRKDYRISKNEYQEKMNINYNYYLFIYLLIVWFKDILGYYTQLLEILELVLVPILSSKFLLELPLLVLVPIFSSNSPPLFKLPSFSRNVSSTHSSLIRTIFFIEIILRWLRNRIIEYYFHMLTHSKLVS